MILCYIHIFLPQLSESSNLLYIWHRVCFRLFQPFTLFWHGNVALIFQSKAKLRSNRTHLSSWYSSCCDFRSFPTAEHGAFEVCIASASVHSQFILSPFPLQLFLLPCYVKVNQSLPSAVFMLYQPLALFRLPFQMTKRIKLFVKLIERIKTFWWHYWEEIEGCKSAFFSPTIFLTTNK